MKKLLFLCCIMAAANTLVFAQSAQVAKDFSARAGRLNVLLEQNKTAEASAAWDEVNNMMMTQLDGIKTHMKAAAGANNAAETERLNNAAGKLFDIYSSVVRMRNDMVHNRAAIKTKLDAFAAGI